MRDVKEIIQYIDNMIKEKEVRIHYLLGGEEEKTVLENVKAFILSDNPCTNKKT